MQLDIEKDAAITALKKKISDRTGGKLALNDMILTLGANVCKRSMTVRQAGIKNNVQIILTLKEDLAKFKVSLSDERDMTQEEVRAALQMVGVAVDVVDDIDPEDKVKSQQKKPYRNADGESERSRKIYRRRGESVDRWRRRVRLRKVVGNFNAIVRAIGKNRGRFEG